MDPRHTHVLLFQIKIAISPSYIRTCIRAYIHTDAS